MKWLLINSFLIVVDTLIVINIWLTFLDRGKRYWLLLNIELVNIVSLVTLLVKLTKTFKIKRINNILLSMQIQVLALKHFCGGLLETGIARVRFLNLYLIVKHHLQVKIVNDF